MSAPETLERNAGGKSAAEVRRMFTAVAARYDLLNHLLSLGLDLTWRAQAAREACALPPRAVILDVCTGTGDLAFALRRVAPESRVVGLDFTPAMIQLAQQKRPRHGPVFFGIGDAMSLPLHDNSVDLVTVAFGIRNVANLTRGLGELIRVVRPGGKVAILEFTRPQGRLFGSLYQFYFRHLLPGIGRLLARASGDAYRYLPQSVQAFAGPAEMKRRMEDAGLRDVDGRPLTFGVVHLYVGRKT